MHLCVCVCVAAQICSLMRGGIAERGGVRVGHRIIEINGQSVVATAHEKIVQALSNSVGEVKHTHKHVHTHFSVESTSNPEIIRGMKTPPVSSLPDPHENHAGCHVQTPDRTGDAHVHITSVLATAAGCHWFAFAGGEGLTSLRGRMTFSTLFHLCFEPMNLDLHLFPMQHFNMKRQCVRVCVCLLFICPFCAFTVIFSDRASRVNHHSLFFILM